jgi:AcrR family transcriptional regulator
MDGKKPMKRKYELKQRAVEMAETRRRITEAAVELHGTVGPARTTLSAVAERAGVQRHTVYRHFPDELALFGACSAHYFSANPWPDLEPWRAIRDPQQRLARALDDLYAYYERTKPMLSNVLRDLELIDAIQLTIVPLQEYLAEAAGILAADWPARDRRRRVLDAALRHAIDFQTWHSLTAGDHITHSSTAQPLRAAQPPESSKRKRNEASYRKAQAPLLHLPSVSWLQPSAPRG